MSFVPSPMPPVGRRFGIFVLGGLLIFPGLYFGGKFSDRGRNTIGVIIAICSYIPLLVGFILLSLCYIPSTWGWWL